MNPIHLFMTNVASNDSNLEHVTPVHALPIPEPNDTPSVLL